jgi:hypothetical protein
VDDLEGFTHKALKKYLLTCSCLQHKKLN